MKLIHAARLSRLNGASTGLDKQDLQASTYARAYGHEIASTATDSDVSGSTDPFKRPGLGPWLADPALMTRYDGIVASHLDRLGRNARHLSKLRDWAEDNDKKLIVISPPLQWPPADEDLASPIIWDVLARLAEYELAAITRRNRETRAYLKSNNFLTGRPPFGYVIAASGAHKTLVPDPVQASEIRRAASALLEGASLRDLCARLDDDGIAPPRGARWSPVSLGKILRNEVLAGRQRDASGHLLLKVEPVLDRETWTLVQAELDRRASRKGIPQGGAALLTGVARCAACGGPMYRHNAPYRRGDGSRVTKLYYRCKGTDKIRSTCRNMVPLADLDRWLDEQVLASGGFVTEIIVTPGDGHEQEIADADARIRALDFGSAADRDRLPGLLAERDRLADIPHEPARVEERVTNFTVADLWETLDHAGKRRYLLGSGVQVIADKHARRLEGDLTFVASGGAPYLAPDTDTPASRTRTPKVSTS